jgi:uncharacterized protein (TIGR00251 family)
MSEWFRLAEDGAVILSVHAQPGAKRTEVAGLHGGSVKIRLAAPALDDRANDALLAFVADCFGVARRGVTVVSGAKSREKRLAIRGSAITPSQALGLAAD